MDARSESYTPEVLLVLLRGVSAETRHTKTNVTQQTDSGSADCRSEHAQCVLLSPLAKLDGVSVLLLLPLERPSLLGVLQSLPPAELAGVVLI